MDFDEYQRLASRMAIYPRIGDNIYYPAIALAGESGEVCNKISKIMRDHNDVITDAMRLELEKELGDVLWNLSQLATELCLSLDEVAINNLRKLKSRKNRNKLHGSGNHR